MLITTTARVGGALDRQRQQLADAPTPSASSTGWP